MNAFASKRFGQFPLIGRIVHERSIFEGEASLSVTLFFIFTTLPNIMSLRCFEMVISGQELTFFGMLDAISHPDILSKGMPIAFLNGSYRTRHFMRGVLTHSHQSLTGYVFQPHKFILRFCDVFSDPFWLHVLFISFQFLCADALPSELLFVGRFMETLTGILRTFLAQLSIKLLRTESIEEIVHNIFNR